MEREMTREAECVLVFSCHDKFDVDETNFTEAILKELHERELTPLNYNLSGRENLDVDMLYRSTVGIVVVSNCLAHSGQSLDHLVTVMEYWKAKDLVIIPVYLKVTPSDIVLRGLLEVGFPEFQSSIQADRVQKCKAVLSELASMDGYQWTKG
uniref:Toll/interleukin-1 receptor-like protein n=1 Tax=Noccaea caerulescens TaxID=107243 RepID=A0A1J3IKX0_NOCCA